MYTVHINTSDVLVLIQTNRRIDY